jgi:hypothetical protein
VHIECRLLPGHGLDDGGIGMADTGHVVVHVDVTPPGSVEQVNAFAPDDFERLVIEQLCAGTQRFVPTGLQ